MVAPGCPCRASLVFTFTVGEFSRLSVWRWLLSPGLDMELRCGIPWPEHGIKMSNALAKRSSAQEAQTPQADPSCSARAFVLLQAQTPSSHPTLE